MLVLVETMAVNPRCWTSCCFHLSSVMDDFNAFPTSEVNPSCSFLGACEVVATTKTRIHCRRALYYVITQMVNCKCSQHLLSCAALPVVLSVVIFCLSNWFILLKDYICFFFLTNIYFQWVIMHVFWNTFLLFIVSKSPHLFNSVCA